MIKIFISIFWVFLIFSCSNNTSKPQTNLPFEENKSILPTQVSKDLDLQSKKDSMIQYHVDNFNTGIFYHLLQEQKNKIIGNYSVNIKDNKILEDTPITNSDKWIRIDNFNIPDGKYNIVISNSGMDISY